MTVPQWLADWCLVVFVAVVWTDATAILVDSGIYLLTGYTITAYARQHAWLALAIMLFQVPVVPALFVHFLHVKAVKGW